MYMHTWITIRTYYERVPSQCFEIDFMNVRTYDPYICI